MAGSDKNARRSDTSGSAPEPSKPISKAESGEVAGQLLNSLKSAEKPLSALSHETRLGMAVITILFCAFCFLVYHKMDLHEKQRQLASIQPNGADSEPNPEANADDTVATVSNQNTDASPEIVDPLINREDLSEGSPFADDAMTAAESQAASAPGLLEHHAPNESLLAMAEPTEATQLLDQNTPAAAEEPAMPSFDAIGASQLEEPTLPNIQDNFQSEPSSGLTEVAANANASPATTDETPSFGFNEPTEPTEPSKTESAQTSSSTEPTAFAALDETPGLNAAESEAPKPIGDINSAPPSDVSAEATSAFDQETESAAIAEASIVNDKQPVLIAMAEPQGQQDGFSGGFSPDGFAAEESTSGVTPGRAPVSEPQDSFSSFDAEPAQPRKPVNTQTDSFGGGGFNAVTQPGGRASSIRTAAGSGAEADGKFSLAAFNYQNTNVEAAPDDGSTFESIKVQNGDNYSKISKRVYGTTRYFSALAVFNQHRIQEPKNMRPGMIVLTPPAEVLEQRYPQLFEDMKPRVPEPAEFLELEDGSPAYRVGERETLSEISKRFLGRSSRWVEIYRMNQTIVQDPNRLKPGIILALPADATEVHVSP